MSKDLKKIEHAQERNELAKKIKTIRNLNFITDKVKSNLITPFLNEMEDFQNKEKIEKIQSVIDKFWSSADYLFYESDIHGYPKKEYYNTLLKGKGNEKAVCQDFSSSGLIYNNSFSFDQFKKGNNIFYISPHGLGCG